MRSRPLIADTGGLLRALARTAEGEPAFPSFEAALRTASRVIVPSLVLPEVDYFLRADRASMRKLVGELFDPATTYEYEAVTPQDIVRALHIDAKFEDLELGLVDGAIAAVAERRRVYRVLTTDRRDLSAVRVGPRWRVPLELVV